MHCIVSYELVEKKVNAHHIALQNLLKKVQLKTAFSFACKCTVIHTLNSRRQKFSIWSVYISKFQVFLNRRLQEASIWLEYKRASIVQRFNVRRGHDLQ